MYAVATWGEGRGYLGSRAQATWGEGIGYLGSGHRLPGGGRGELPGETAGAAWA